MIRRLRLHGWRSFEEQSLEIRPGLTFVLAENGIGKTSLVEAAAWGVYGELSGVDPDGARRVGFAEARVEVDLELLDGRVLHISRVAQARGEAVVGAAVGNQSVSPGNLPGLLAESFGASAEFLARTTLLPSRAVADEATNVFSLREHLSRVLGVDDLERAADKLDSLHRAADAEAKTFRVAERRAAADLATLEDECAQADQRLTVLQEAQNQAGREVERAEGQLDLARRRADDALRAAGARQAFQEAVSAARTLWASRAAVPAPTTTDELVTLLEQSEQAAAGAVDDVRRNLAVVAARVESITMAAAELETTSGSCLVCRRPLSDEDVAHARRGHQEDLAALGQRQTALQTNLEAASRHLDAVRAVLRQAMAVPHIEDAPPAGDSPDLADADGALRSARGRLNEVSAELLAIRAARTSLQRRIEAERAAGAEREASLLAHRKAAVSRVAADVARATARQLLAERIDPLAAEVRARWKRVFGDRGVLQLAADGRLTLRRGVDDIAFEYLSSGEKVIALLAVRLLVLGSSTRASFLWLDEPLEHLDPRNRRLAASLMSAAGGNVRQLLVTTYEEDLARRLASRGQATLVRVRSADSSSA